MIRVLHVIGKMDIGGAETLLMNIYRNIDRNKIQFDFMVHTAEESFYDKEIRKMGGKIYRTSRFNIFNLRTYIQFWNNFFPEHPEYRIVHGHINSSAAVYLSLAKKYHRIAVVHSHATKSTEKNLRTLAFRLCSYPVRYIADYYFGCSVQAGIDRFGMKVADSRYFCVLKNGIESRKYSYDVSKRLKVRVELGISENQIVVGHVGRFTAAKNHKFLIDLFSVFNRKYPNSVLCLIGQGELEDTLRNQVQTLKIEDKVLFLGTTDRVNDYLQAMDVFVFPSLFEGLGIALIEAQAAGLHCVVSQNIQEEADIKAGLITKLNLSDSWEKWADQIYLAACDDRFDTQRHIEQTGFDISSSVRQLTEFYMSVL